MSNGRWYLDPTFLPAAFGLIGVIVGGLITAGSSFLLERRRERKLEEKEKRTHDAEMRTAARLVELDLRIARACAKVSVENSTWSENPKGQLTCQHWDRYCATLAPALSLNDWVAVVISTITVSYLNIWREQARQQNHIVIEPNMIVRLQTYMRQLEAGRVILLNLGGPDSASAMSALEGVESQTPGATAG